MPDKYIEDLEFSGGTYRVLKRSGINTEEHLVNMLLSELKNVRNIGIKRVVEVITVLSNNSYLENGYLIVRGTDNDHLLVKEIVEKILNGDFE